MRTLSENSAEMLLGFRCRAIEKRQQPTELENDFGVRHLLGVRHVRADAEGENYGEWLAGVRANERVEIVRVAMEVSEERRVCRSARRDIANECIE